MSYFLLPKNNVKNILNFINSVVVDINTKEDDLYILSKSLKFYLNDIKKEINELNKEWDIFKKYTNPYEYIHSVISISYKFSISKLKPLSRAFYKMIEIAHLFQIFDNYPDKLNSFHLAEGPGGFIEAFTFIRKNLNDKYYGMTLVSENPNIPSWKKSKLFLQKHNNVFIENGIHNNGNLLDIDNLLFCLEKYHQSMDIITGDGGFDFSTNFENQELVSINLIFSQICFALAMQKKGGIFILKIFDIFTYSSLDLIYLLSSLYEKVFIVKPNTSRFANSEKYIVCKNFILDDTRLIVEKLSKTFYLFKDTNRIYRFLDIKIPYYFKNKIEELNAIFGQQQTEIILSTFNLINNNKQERLEQYRKNNISKCIIWCQKHNIPYNKLIQDIDNE